VLKDYPFLRSLARRKTHCVLNLLYHLIGQSNWYDATKILQCFPDGFTVKEDHSYSRFIRQAFEHGEKELAELMMDKAALKMIHYLRSKEELTEFDQWYGEHLVRSNQEKKKEIPTSKSARSPGH